MNWVPEVWQRVANQATTDAMEECQDVAEAMDQTAKEHW